MAKEKKRKRISKFYVIYFAVTAAAILLILTALVFVRRLLAEYEEAQPKYVAARVFEEYFEPVDYDRLFENYGEDEKLTKKVVEYLKEQIGDAHLTYSIGSSNEEDEIRYNVKVGQMQFASIVLEVSGQKTPHGFTLYDFSRIDLNLNVELLPPEFVVTIKVPAGYSVFVDGEVLTREQLISSYENKEFMKYYPSDVSGIPYETYSLTAVGELPEMVTAADPRGMEAALTDYEEDTYTYTFGLVYDEALLEEYSDFVINAMKEYAAYIQASEDASLSRIKKYFDADSVAYADVVKAGSSRWMVTDWNSLDFEDEYAGEFYAYTPEIFSCRVSLTQVLRRTGREDFTDRIDMILFLHQDGDGYKIYEWYKAS